MDVKDRVFVVTGGGNGMGREVVLGLLARGARVAAADLSEAGLAETSELAQAPEGRVDALLPHIRSFRIEIDSVEGVTKLSQTHPAGDRARVIDALEARGWFGDQEIAALMRENERTAEEN